jgi:hypothetical protein
MHLRKVTLPAVPTEDHRPAAPKSYDLDVRTDPFWMKYGREPFPTATEGHEVEAKVRGLEAVPCAGIGDPHGHTHTRTRAFVHSVAPPSPPELGLLANARHQGRGPVDRLAALCPVPCAPAHPTPRLVQLVTENEARVRRTTAHAEDAEAEMELTESLGTKGLVDAVDSLPALLKQKKMLEMHTNVLQVLVNPSVPRAPLCVHMGLSASARPLLTFLPPPHTHTRTLTLTHP